MMFAGIVRSRESVLSLVQQIDETRSELEFHMAQAEARRALLVELEAACEALRRRADNAANRRRVQDGARRPPRQLPP